MEFYPAASLDFIRIHFIRHALSGCLYFIRSYFTRIYLLSDRSPHTLSGRLDTICYSFTVRSRGEPKNHSKYLVSYHKVVGNDPPKPLKMLGFRPKAMGNDPPKLLKMLHRQCSPKQLLQRNHSLRKDSVSTALKPSNALDSRRAWPRTHPWPRSCGWHPTAQPGLVTSSNSCGNKGANLNGACGPPMRRDTI